MSKEVGIQLIHRVLSLLPGIWLILLWSYAFRVAILVNHWPYYGHPDPATLGMLVHADATMYSFPLGIASVIAWTILTPFFWKYLTKRTIILNASIFLLCFVISVVQITIDPGGVVDWFLD